ncbi:MAG TPA: PDZ domain-containing protein [Gemmatimonadaceae bacterium]|nr:PDZ domain-containing protein [Gemmatimonadaceae bacterium]
MPPINTRTLIAAMAAVLLSAPRATSGAQPSSNSTAPLLLRQPAVSASDICFEFAGDLWLVPRAGGTAHRLTASPGREFGCHFSSDGRWIAYTGTSSNNNLDVFVIAVTGGEPQRLTYNPATDQARGWTPDGKVLFASGRAGVAPGGSAPPRLFVQAVDAVTATPVDLPSGFDGTFSSDGRRLAYMPIIPANDIWKRYRGGRTTPIWIATMSNAAIEKIPRSNSNDKAPMWVGDTVFFLSDRDGATTLYAYDLGTKKVTRRIENGGLDIKNASAGPGAIVYEQFGAIRLYDLRTGHDGAVPITISGALTGAMPHWVRVGSRLGNASISPTGARAAFEARGEILTVPAKKGDARNLTNTVGATERSPAWSPDGQTIAYFSDAGGGGYRLELRTQSGMGEPRTLTLGDNATFYYAPLWSPDSKTIAYTNSRGEIWRVDIATGKTTKVDADPAGPRGSGSVLYGGLGMSWSPDSKWLAYGRTLKNRLSAVFVHDLAKGSSTQVTDGMSDAKLPTFDASGKYLYFVASTDAGPASDFSMMTFDHPVTSNLYAIVMRKDLPSPLAPESDDEKAKSESIKPAAAAGASDSAAKAGPPRPANAPAEVRIDLDGVDQRTIAMPVPARNYVGVAAGKAGIVLLAEAPLVPVDQAGPGAGGLTLYKFDLAERKTDKLVEQVGDFDVSRDGEKLLFRQRDAWTIAPVNAIKPGEGTLATANLQVQTDPRAEWREMYREAFRLQRAFFYDPEYHGLDLAATEKFYSKWVDGLGSRDDLSYLFEEIFGNLTVGHLFVSGPPPEGGPGAPPADGVLGADYAAESGRWRFARVYAGESWNPQFRAPLTQPGVNVQAGEFLLAVNGRDLTSSQSVDEALQGTAGKAVILHVGPNASGAGARDVTVVPLASEGMLRHLAWIDNNRRTVDKLSGGKLAYIYVPNTAGEGYTRFNRYFFAQQDKLGAVVDERFNGGGNIADYMIEYMRRDAPFNYVTARYGDDQPIPAGAIYGPKVMLINEYAGSGGDELPWLFRRFKVGQLVGTRTWGGLVGIGGYPALMDGASVTAPRIALWSPESDYPVENKGVAPDVEVEIDPAAWRAGHDTQLERAVALLMQTGVVQAGAPVTGKRPPFPTWAKGKTPHE